MQKDQSGDVSKNDKNYLEKIVLNRLLQNQEFCEVR